MLAFPSACFFSHIARGYMQVGTHDELMSHEGGYVL